MIRGGLAMFVAAGAAGATRLSSRSLLLLLIVLVLLLIKQFLDEVVNPNSAPLRFGMASVVAGLTLFALRPRLRSTGWLRVGGELNPIRVLRRKRSEADRRLPKLQRLKRLGKGAPQLNLLLVAQNAMQVPVKQVRVLDVQSPRPSPPQLLENRLLREVSAAQPQRHHLVAPLKEQVVEHEKVDDQLCRRQVARPTLARCLHLWVVLALAPRLEARGRQERYHDVLPNLQEVDGHQSEGVGGEVAPRGTAHLRTLCPQLDGDPQLAHPGMHVCIRLQKLGIL
mmetsp:Transcript_115488/g.333584  ORF Transcript_115488/g.333584 Transcript_115488/m.333584 type:complete len:282 (-) Transcript_115488:839-1684(-)